MSIGRIFLLYIFLFLSTIFISVSAQEDSFNKDMASIKELVRSFQMEDALYQLDSMLQRPIYSQRELASFGALKTEALMRVQLFEDALLTSQSVLENPDAQEKTLVKVRMVRALVFEFIEEYDKVQEELDKIALYYTNHEKDHLYNEYLYRTSSLLRVSGGSLEKANEYALRAKTASIKTNDTASLAVSNMLLGFLAPQDSIRIKQLYFMEAIATWKDFGDYHGVNNMYGSMARLERDQGNYDRALVYLDSAKANFTKYKDVSLESGILEIESNIYEKRGDYRKALAISQESWLLSEQYNESLKRIATNQLDYRFKIEKEAIEKEEVEKDLMVSKSNLRQTYILIGVLVFLCIAIAILATLVNRRKHKIKVQRNVIVEKNERLKKAVGERELLLREAHHRVKNNLSLISSLVHLQMDTQEGPARQSLTVLQHRIDAVAKAHQLFMYHNENVMVHKYSLKSYIEAIAEALVQMDTRKAAFESNITIVEVGIDTALPLGILVNELVTNSLEHALVAAKDILRLKLEITYDAGQINLFYADNGLEFVEKTQDTGNGLLIMESMAQQLEGSLSRTGSTYKIILKEKTN